MLWRFEWFVLRCCKGEDGEGVMRRGLFKVVRRVVLKTFRECWRLEVRVWRKSGAFAGLALCA